MLAATTNNDVDEKFKFAVCQWFNQHSKFSFAKYHCFLKILRQNI